MSEKINGRDLMVFIEELPIALATSCSLELTTEEIDARTKDDADGNDKDFDRVTWSVNSENLVGKSDSDNEMFFDELVTTQLAGNLVDVVFARVDRTAAGVPEGGWQKAGATTQLGIYIVKDRIMSISLNAPVDGKASATVKFEGRSPLKPSNAEQL